METNPSIQEAMNRAKERLGFSQPGPAPSTQPAVPVAQETAAPAAPVAAATQAAEAPAPQPQETAAPTPAAPTAESTPAQPATPEVDPFADIRIDADVPLPSLAQQQGATPATGEMPAAALSQLAAETGETFATQADIATRLKALKEENAALKAAPQYADPRLAAADKAKRMGIDPLVYLKVAETDPIAGLTDEQIVLQDYKYTAPQATAEELQEFMDGLHPSMVKMQANRIRHDYATYRANTVAQMERDAQAQRALDNANFRQAAASIKDWNGLPVSPQQIEKVVQVYESGDLMSLFGNDPAKIVGAVLNELYGRQYVEATKKKAIAETKSETYRKVTNATSPIPQEPPPAPAAPAPLTQEQIRANYAEKARSGFRIG